jgi:PKD repeat protein
VVFTNASTGVGLSYNWDFGDGTFATTENASHGYTTPGEYTIILTATDSSGTASDTDMMIINVIDCNATGVAGQQFGDDFMVFSSPAHEVIYVQVPANNLTGRLELLDASGRILISRSFNNEENIAINASSIAAGVYCLRIVNDHSYVIKKVIIE